MAGIFNPVSIGRPGIGTPETSSTRFVFVAGTAQYLPGGGTIDGAKTRDAQNTPDQRTLQAGLLMGKVTASGKYANSTIGLTLAAIAANATSLPLSVAAATELARRVGASGNLLIIGPPTAAGSIASQTVAYSAVNLTTGVVTISAIPAAVVTGSRVCDTDGSAIPTTMIGDGTQITIGENNADQYWAAIPSAAYLDENLLLNWPADASARATLRSQLGAGPGSKFSFMSQI